MNGRKITPLNILITGASGFVGSHLKDRLTQHGHSCQALPRTGNSNVLPRWLPEKGECLLPSDLPWHAVIHLAGQSIACRWTSSNKDKIRRSRVDGTRLLCETLAASEPKPQTLICASATGFYGDRGDSWLTEESPPGTGFLADVCQEWEQASEPARHAGIRVVLLRFGMVLAPDGGALKSMLPIFRLGLGGKVGDGQQYWSWISMPDLLSIVEFALRHETLSGPVNCVSPNPVTNQTFTAILSQQLHRPAVIPLPKFAARAVLGEMANEALLASARVQPQTLIQKGFTYDHPKLSGALEAVLS